MVNRIKAVALVVSARKKGNCYEFAQFILDYLEKKSIDTEIINFCEYKINPCCCSYECVQVYDPHIRCNNECPLEDDVLNIWEKTKAAEILLIFVPTYGGLPPASWVAYTQRMQPLYTTDEIKKGFVCAVVLASPHWSAGTEWTPAIMADEIKHMNREVVGFEVINNAGYETENLFGGLITEHEIQRRLLFLAERILAALHKHCIQKLINTDK